MGKPGTSAPYTDVRNCEVDSGKRLATEMILFFGGDYVRSNRVCYESGGGKDDTMAGGFDGNVEWRHSMRESGYDRIFGGRLVDCSRCRSRCDEQRHAQQTFIADRCFCF